jgi:putative redox protein
MNARVIWTGGMAFRGEPPSGHPVSMDAAPAVGGGDTAARPLELVVVGLAGCSGMDVVSVLAKMRQQVTSLEVEVEAIQAEDHPRRLTRVSLVYRVGGKDLDPEKVRRAVELSQEKYCSVAATLRSPVEVTWRVEPAAGEPA